MKDLTADQREAIEEIRSLDDETIDMIRRTRLESKKFVLNQSDTWLNNMILICFGLGGALIPIATSTTLSGRYQHKVLIWLGVGILIANGIYLLMRTIRSIASDQLGLQVAGLKEEYYLVRRRNTAAQLLQGSGNMNAFQTAATELQGHANTIAGSRNKANKVKANYDTGIATGLLFSGLYLVAFAGISMRFRYILLIYLVGAIAYTLATWKDASDAAPILKDRAEWERKIDEEEKRMTQETRDYVSPKKSLH